MLSGTSPSQQVRLPRSVTRTYAQSEPVNLDIYGKPVGLVLFGKAKLQYHSLDDPAAVEGSEEKWLDEFSRMRDKLRSYLKSFGIARP